MVRRRGYILPRYFFDVQDGENTERDSEGLLLSDRFEAGRTAIEKLRAIRGGRVPPDDVRHTSAIFVRDEGEQPVLKAALNFAFHWLDTEPTAMSGNPGETA